MPIYEYRCCDCGQIFEEWQREHKALDLECPVCGGKSEHIISNTSFVLKGSGWYVTDYARGNSSSPSNGGNGNGDGNGDGKNDKADGKSESKSETKSESKTSSSKSESKSSAGAQA